MFIYSNLFAFVAVVTLFDSVIAIDKPLTPGLADEKQSNLTAHPRNNLTQLTTGPRGQPPSPAHNANLLVTHSPTGSSDNHKVKPTEGGLAKQNLMSHANVSTSAKISSLTDPKLVAALEHTKQGRIPNPSKETLRNTKYPITLTPTASSNLTKHTPGLGVVTEPKPKGDSNLTSVRATQTNGKPAPPKPMDWTAPLQRVRSKPVAVLEGKTKAIKPATIAFKGPPPPIVRHPPPSRDGWNVQITPSIRTNSFIFVNIEKGFQSVEPLHPTWQLVEGSGSTPGSFYRIQGGYNYGFQLRDAPAGMKFITTILPGVNIFYGLAGYVLTYSQKYYQLPAWYTLGDPLPDQWWLWNYDSQPYQCSNNYDALDASDCNQAFRGLADYWDENSASIPPGGKTAYGRSCKASITCLDDNVKIPIAILKNDADPLGRPGGANLILQSCVSQGRAGWVAVAGDCSIAFESTSGVQW